MKIIKQIKISKLHVENPHSDISKEQAEACLSVFADMHPNSSMERIEGTFIGEDENGVYVYSLYIMLMTYYFVVLSVFIGFLSFMTMELEFILRGGGINIAVYAFLCAF